MGKFIALILALIFGCKAINGAPQPEPIVREAFCKCGENCPCVDCDCNDVKLPVAVETKAPLRETVPAPKPEAKTAPAHDAPKVAPTQASARPQSQPAPQPAGRWEYYRRGLRRWERVWVPTPTVRTPTGYKPLPRAVNC